MVYALRWIIVGLLLWPSSAAAQEAPEIEVPSLIFDVVGDPHKQRDDKLDLDNIVQTAAKGITTVQEAPAIVTVVTAEDIRDRGYTDLEDLFDTVPGWLRHDGLHNQFPFPLTRGTVQAMLYMQNGLSLFDPFANVAQVGRIMPLEIVKRVEIITGPGGVLWGANSFLGVVNIVTKDADDIDGVEASVSFGDGPGDEGMFRGYVMTGITEIGHEDVSLFLHGSFETYRGPRFELPGLLFSPPLPQPNGPYLYGPLVESSAARSWLFNIDGKLTLGKVDIHFAAPFVERQLPLGFPGNVIREDLIEDGHPDCEAVDPFLPDGQINPEVTDSQDVCADNGRLARQNRVDWFDRYAMAVYRTRFANNAAGATVKAYVAQFVRDFKQLQILMPIPSLLEGGLGFTSDATSYRAGGAYDGDVNLGNSWRVLYGAEGFHEWIPSNIQTARQTQNGDLSGIEVTWTGPADLNRLPLPCPREPDPNNPGATRFVAHCPLTFLFASNRTVLGTYLNPQWRPTRKLRLDAGVRAQAAPAALGKRDYPLELLFSGAAVYNFTEGWHAKVNYAEGFRAPVFNNTDSNGEAVQIDGRPDLEVETSQAIQGEVNARLFKGRRGLRELSFRADYSYTRLDNLIQIQKGRYNNSGERGIHSAELLAKIYLKGGHRFELGYTWLRIAQTDKGMFRSMPENWLNATAFLNLIEDRLSAMFQFKIVGAFEDPNKIVEYRGYTEDPVTGHVLDPSGNEALVVVSPSEVVLDRLPPSAELAVGLTYTPTKKLRFRGFVYNAFDTRHYNPDAFAEYEPRLENLPNPYPDLRFVLNASYDY